jgi:hypothetical protein
VWETRGWDPETVAKHAKTEDKMFDAQQGWTYRVNIKSTGEREIEQDVRQQILQQREKPKTTFKARAFSSKSELASSDAENSAAEISSSDSSDKKKSKKKGKRDKGKKDKKGKQEKTTENAKGSAKRRKGADKADAQKARLALQEQKREELQRKREDAKQRAQLIKVLTKTQMKLATLVLQTEKALHSTMLADAGEALVAAVRKDYDEVQKISDEVGQALATKANHIVDMSEADVDIVHDRAKLNITKLAAVLSALEQ